METARHLTHIAKDGALRMVDVTAKPVTFRHAVAKGEIVMQPETVALVAGGLVPKGNVFEAARIAGVMAAKMTGNIIPLCHPLRITGVDISFAVDRDKIQVEVSVSTADRTGVEMEALAATSVALLTIYDMCKAVDKSMVISHIRLIKKTGGQSGTYVREEGGRRKAEGKSIHRRGAEGAKKDAGEQGSRGVEKL